jgi:ribosome biogenesis GTPase
MHTDSAGLGRRPELSDELDALGHPALSGGRVLAHHRGRWLVAEPGEREPRLLPARGRLRDDPPTTGDWVAVDAGGAIATVLERRGAIVRRRAGTATGGQTLAANVDVALVTEPLPDPNERRAERLVALASAGGVPAALVLAKADLDPDGQLAAARLARRLGLVDGVAVSANDGQGLALLRGLLEPGSTAVLLGPSGAGKSTLVNALLGEQRQATGAVRAGDGRGRHTTVTRELVALPGGALLVDTPGLREVGLWDGAGAAFTDIDELAESCRFADCRHETEPGCAVRAAVGPDRIAAWRKLAREQAWVDDRRAAARERDRRHREITLSMRRRAGGR